MASNVLTERDVNAQPVEIQDNDDAAKAQTTESSASQRSVASSRSFLTTHIPSRTSIISSFHSTIHSNQNPDQINREATTTYISPSDTILSPASKKLADFRSKQTAKSYEKLCVRPSIRNVFANIKTKVKAQAAVALRLDDNAKRPDVVFRNGRRVWKLKVKRRWWERGPLKKTKRCHCGREYIVACAHGED